jgi:hypothetical protein
LTAERDVADLDRIASGYDWDWFQPAFGNNNYVYSGNLLRPGFSQNLETWGWNAEFAVPFLLGLPTNATGTVPQQGALGLGANYASANGGRHNTAMIFPKQLYVRFDGFGTDKRQTLQVGRFTFVDGSEVTPKNATLSVLKRVHSLRLCNANDLWYSGGGLFQPWTFGYTGRSTSGRRSLGNLYDTSLEYRLNRKVTLTAYAGYTQGLAVMEQIYQQGKDGRLGYLEFFYRF